MSRAFKLKRPLGLLAAVGLMLLAQAAASASAPGRPGGTTSPRAWRGATDPLEPLNRRLYRADHVIQTVVLRPILGAALMVLPKPAQSGLHNLLQNAGEPVTAVNDVLQLRADRAGIAARRFVTNSTLGVLGLFDVAKRQGLEHHSADFGLTLGRYGVPTGPYVFVPVIGPSSLRDAAARYVNGALDPFSYLHYHGDDAVGDGRTVLSTLDTTAQGVNGDAAADPYLATRTAYWQARALPARNVRVEPGDVQAFERERQAAFAQVSGSFFQPVQ